MVLERDVRCNVVHRPNPKQSLSQPRNSRGNRRLKTGRSLPGRARVFLLDFVFWVRGFHFLVLFLSADHGSLAETQVDDRGHLCADVLAVSAALLAGPGVGAGPMGLIWSVVCVELYLGGKSKIWSFGFWICFGVRISYLVPPSPSQPPT